MTYTIVSKTAFTVYGLSKRVNVGEGENLQTIPQFWRDTREDDSINQISALSKASDIFPHQILGVCADPAPDWSEFSYLIAAQASGEVTVDGLVKVDVPANDWAVFESVGPLPEAIQTVWKAVFSDFLPKEPYKHAVGPELEVYPAGDMTGDDYKCEVWIPVTAK